MSVIKVLELVGISDKSWDDAVQNALGEASRSVRNIKGIDVLRTTAKVQDNRVVEYHADVKFAFQVESGG
jgi:flavin-binding protein dodecin